MLTGTHRYATYLALPSMAVAILGAAATGVATAANAAPEHPTANGVTQSSTTDTKRPSMNLVRSSKVHSPSMTAPSAALSVMENPGHPGLDGPSMKRPESRLDVSTHARSELVTPASN